MRDDILLDRELPTHGIYATADDDHRFCPAVDEGGNVYPVMLDDDTNLLGDVVRVELHPAHELLERTVLVYFLLVELLAFVREFESQAVRRVVLEHVEDELLFDGLAHRIDVERRRDIVL